MTNITYFTVTGDYASFSRAPVNGKVTFHAALAAGEVARGTSLTPPTVVLNDSYEALIINGVLSAKDGTPGVPLPANVDLGIAGDLYYRVFFDIPGVPVNNLAFLAPTDTTGVNLVTVTPAASAISMVEPTLSVSGLSDASAFGKDWLLLADAIAAREELGIADTGGAEIAADTHAASSKATLADADEFPVVDTEASNGLKKFTWGGFKAWVRSWFGVINVKDYGAKGDGVTDDTAAILAAFAAIPSDGAEVRFPSGIYRCTTVASGVILNLANKPFTTLRGVGQSSTIRFEASCTDALRIDTCTAFKMEDLRVEVTVGTVTRAVHYTSSSPGSVHLGRFRDVVIDNPTSVSRNAYDVMTTASSTTIWSAAAAFAAGDVGARVMIDYQTAPHVTTINSVSTVSSTLAADIDASTSTVTLSSALTGTPTDGFTVLIGTERMYVVAGGNTTTLTVSRGRGKDFIHGPHTAGDAVTVYKATLADAVPFSTGEPAGMIRIEATSAHMDYGLAIGMDHPGASNMDIANTKFDGVAVTHAVVAGIAVGNGTTGNILDQWGYGLTIAECGYAVLMNGGALSIDGADFGYSLVDIKRLQPVSQEVKFDGIRTEELGRLYEYPLFNSGGPSTRLTSIEALSIHCEDGGVVRHLAASSLLLENVQLTASELVNGSVYIIAQGSGPNVCHVAGINVGSTTGAASVFLDLPENELWVVNETIISATTGEVVTNTNVPNRIDNGWLVTSGSIISDTPADGVVLKDTAGHYWRVTVSTGGVLTTTDLGTTRPTS